MLLPPAPPPPFAFFFTIPLEPLPRLSFRSFTCFLSGLYYALPDSPLTSFALEYLLTILLFVSPNSSLSSSSPQLSRQTTSKHVFFPLLSRQLWSLRSPTLRITLSHATCESTLSSSALLSNSLNCSSPEATPFTTNTDRQHPILAGYFVSLS